MTDVELATPDTEALATADIGELEDIIGRGLGSFMEVGYALAAIREGKKYQDRGYDTFESYCADRWGFTRQRAHQFIKGTQRALEVGTAVDITPRSEYQVRPLTSVPLERATAAWADAVQEAGGGQPTASQVTEAVRRAAAGAPRRERSAISHPARFSTQLFPHFVELLEGCRDVLDPFAGTGLIHLLEDQGFQTVGIELEPEWAELHLNTQVGDARHLPFGDEEFDAICTSPTYGNRMADHHDATDDSERYTYKAALGRDPSDGSTAVLQWGPEYRASHLEAWTEAVRVLRPNGRFVLNVKDHYRDGKWMDVAGWHISTLCELGLQPIAVRPVATRAMGNGENRDMRVDAELVVAFTKGEW